jgi:outer membrane protein OmpA-like peptidoglycan-associated protein
MLQYVTRSDKSLHPRPILLFPYDLAANKKLSQDRADAVKEVLVKSGIEASRMTAAGYGQEKPFASNATEEGKAQNRRLELVVAKK